MLGFSITTANSTTAQAIIGSHHHPLVIPVVDGKPQSSIAVIVCQQHPGTKTDYDMMWRTTFLCIDQLTKPDIRVELHPLAPGCHPPDSAMAPNRRCETSALTPIDIKNADTITWAYLYYLTTYEPTSPASATIPTLK